ncbi:FKBP-type peptidyl-prolyl cis-trans isomerase [uncultured Bacteroides sp.]|uniref:FKBP-type peptidyl-prolyl cis-trans isomerase n=1 Tax=uncultured Bacteroides sp. TaxID=162156 RepID=UPI002607A8AC|nr:FKBP-type peptidyl-prolyl cis-trans isomerase [uncultured Bacteroides sp.]
MDQDIPLPPEKEPTAFDSSSRFAVNGVISGWTTVLQYMREGERWIIYVPWASAYGSDGSSSGGIPGYSTLIFDILLTDVVN